MKINKFIKIWNSLLDSLKISEIKEKSSDNNNNLKYLDEYFKLNEKDALKIIKNVSKYRDAAKLEIKVLNKLKEKDLHGSQ